MVLLATTIFSATQCCNVGKCCTYFKQSRNNVATLCCAKNCCCESSRVTSPLVTALVECLTAEQEVVGSNPGVGPILRVLKQLGNEGSAFALQTARLCVAEMTT